MTTANGAVIWNVSGSGKPGQRQLGTAIINDVEFSPNGKQVVVANDDGKPWTFTTSATAQW